MANVDILIEDERWATPGFEAQVEAACAATLDALDLTRRFEVSLLACDDARITELNTEFRDKPGPTNVLSWPSEDRAPDTPGAMPPLPDAADPMALELGDIALAYETCAREASELGKEFADHVTHLLVHGTLHLLGFDHINDADAARMEGLEVRILANLDLPDPYRA